MDITDVGIPRLEYGRKRKERARGGMGVEDVGVGGGGGLMFYILYSRRKGKGGSFAS